MSRPRKNFLVRIGVILLFFMGIIILWSSGIVPCISFDLIKTHAQWLHQQVETHYFFSVLMYAAVYIAVVVCGLPGAALMNIVGGFLYGFLPALIYITIAATIGATIFFLFIRYVIGLYVQNRYADKLVEFNRRVEQKGWIYLLLIRCVPLVPFFMVNLCAGLTRIPLFTFIWTTAVGILPTAAIFVFAGRQLTRIHQMRDIFSVQVVGSLVLLLLLVLIPVIILL